MVLAANPASPAAAIWYGSSHLGFDLLLSALALDSEPDPAPSGDMNREPADPEPKMEEASTASRRGRPGHIEREAAASCRGWPFGHTVDARQAPRHVVRQRGYLCHLWQ
jgi:hypothetical protein